MRTEARAGMQERRPQPPIQAMDPQPVEIRYREAVVIGWRLFWQGLGSFVCALVGANLVLLELLPELTRSGPSLWALLVPLAVVTLLSVFVLMPLTARSLVRTPFTGFRLRLVRDTDPVLRPGEKEGRGMSRPEARVRASTIVLCHKEGSSC
ncbi:MAG TPA: hypothetical protein VFS39_08470 [Nitrospira sp.]|nr:hypothetical protein [Nitrospira sp.]